MLLLKLERFVLQNIELGGTYKIGEDTIERETQELVIGRGEQVRVLRSGRDLFFVQTVSSEGVLKEGWVPGSWLMEGGVPHPEHQEDSLSSVEASSEASEPELQRLADTEFGTCLMQHVFMGVSCTTRVQSLSRTTLVYGCVSCNSHLERVSNSCLGRVSCNKCLLSRATRVSSVSCAKCL